MALSCVIHRPFPLRGSIVMKRTAFPALLLALSLPAAQAQNETDVEVKFRQLDLNSDGIISGAEFGGHALLPHLDTDKDGRLTLLEAKLALAKGSRQSGSAGSAVAAEGSSDTGGVTGVAEFDRLDKNRDGKLTADELPQKRWMKFLDGDRNGEVTVAEATEAMLRLRDKNKPQPQELKPALPADQDPSLKEAPVPLKAADVGVGRLVPNISLEPGTALVSQIKDQKGLVIALFGATCPISNKLGPELARLETYCRENQVAFLPVCPVPAETAEEIQKFVSDHKIAAPVFHDRKGELVRALNARTTTEVFVLDSARTLIYRGAINDQYGLGYSRDKASRHYLRDALGALLAHEAPAVAATTAPGCELDREPRSASVAVNSQVTYHNQVARIMQANCITCHRDGAVGPFSLETYEDVIEHAGMIRKQVERGAMPPWFAAEPPEGDHSLWMNDTSLSAKDKQNLLGWLASDRPLGDPADAPAPIKFPKEWIHGEPDAIVQIPQPIRIRAEGTMPYQFVTATTNFSEDRWVQGYELLPTDRSVVHHVIVQVHPKGSKVSDRGEGAEGYWAAYVPGNSGHVWPEGFAKKLPAGATVSFQIHYTPNGRATEDQLKLGLHFAAKPPRYIVHTAAVAHPRLRIPAGAPDHVEVKEQTVPMDMNLLGCMAHMHVRGKAFKFEVTPPGGTTEVLLDIPRYDFNWQLRYDYAKPRFLPKGSRVKITAVFDNSDSNPANPDPSREIRWGQQTYDEMMIGYFEYYTANSDVALK